MYVVVAIIAFFDGAVAYAWWISPDLKKLRKTVARLEHDKNRLTAYILRDAKFKAYRNGVEIDVDE